MIDLHAHTDQSDGTLSPAALVKLAVETGIEALAITDHDTFAGYDMASAAPIPRGLELICGIELSTRWRASSEGGRPPSVHLLGYFPGSPPSQEFRRWIRGMLQSRHRRNVELIAKLRSLGLDISLEEVQAPGRNLTARPHFAQVLLHKGYVSSLQEAFDLYLADEAQAAVTREEPALSEAIQRIRQAGGIASLAHPARIRGGEVALTRLLEQLVPAGLNALEVYHSEHGPQEVALYREAVQKFGLIATGGSDFHGATKPGIALGTGRNNNVHLDVSLLEQPGWAACGAGFSLQRGLQPPT
jgi:3',5'-nucleoside bisphosphate phosphatase